VFWGKWKTREFSGRGFRVKLELLLDGRIVAFLHRLLMLSVELVPVSAIETADKGSERHCGDHDKCA
jgi:hypothetical protein